MNRVAILGITDGFRGMAPDINGNYHFSVRFKVLKRGRKRERWIYVAARDEMEAFTEARKKFRNMGFKL